MDSIRSVVRALQVLHSMSEGGEFSLGDIRHRTVLPKSTVFRLLSTLEAEGYVIADHSAGQYRLSAKVRELAGGVSSRSLVVEASAPIALEVTRQIKWPLALGVIDGASIVIRFSTMPQSPLATHSTTLGHRHGLTDSAVGHAYLAFCSTAERDALFGLIRQENGVKSLPDLGRRIDQVRKQGYALRLPREKGDSGTIALPISHGDSVAALLSMTTFGISMNQTTIMKHLPVLTETAARMADAYEAVTHP